MNAAEKPRHAPEKPARDVATRGQVFTPPAIVERMLALIHSTG